MADIRKTFNFRAGVQVDDDVFIVRGEQVGIGTTIPTQSLDVRGNAKVVGILTAQNTDFSAGISTFGDVKIGTGISISASSGIITATTFSGDGSLLQNVPTSAWVQYNQLDDNGLSVVSIAKTTGNVGIATTGASSNNDLQIGSDPQDGFSKGVGIGSDGNIYASGIITATTFRGTLVGTVSTVISTQGNFSNHISVGNTVSIGGTVGLGSHVYFGDESRAFFGDSNDLEIYHTTASGGSSVVEGGSNLLIGGDLVVIKNAALNETQAKFTQGSSIELNHSGNKKFETASSGVNITGITTTDDLKVTGVSTFTGNIDANGNLDVDGTTDLDVLNVAETATFSSNIDANGDLDVDGHTELDNVNISGVVTATTFIGNGDFVDIDVDGHSELDNVNVSGVSTFTGNIDANGNLDVDGQTDLDDVIISGSVGIGTTNPTQKLEVYDGRLVVRNITDDTASIELRDENHSPDYYQIRNQDGTFHIRNSGATPTQFNVISALSTGNVGINSTVPTAKLDVNGNTKLQGDLNVSGVSTFVGNSKFDGLLGIQTASPQTQLHVWDDAAQVARFQSNQTTSIISFVDETSTITPYIGANSNDLILGSVSGGERLRITGIGGSLGIGQTNPEQTFHVVGTSTVTGNSFFGGTVKIRGNTTVDANLTVDSLTVPSLNAHIIGNNAKIHSTSGISTVAAFKATGISTFSGNVTVTDGNTFQVNDGVKRFFVSASGKVGIKTTAGEDDVTIAGDTLFKTSVSVGNTARCAVDFSEVVNIQYNDGTNRSLAAYMLPPIVTTAQRNALVDGRVAGQPVINGAIVFNSDAGRLEIRQGNNWYGIGTVA